MSEELKAALARIACLEGEIAKRDGELAACRIAVENCELFRARIAELEARIVWLECEAQVNAAPVSEAKAQGVYSADPLACSGCASGCFRCRDVAKAQAVVMPDVNAAAKALCNRHAIICGVDADDQWNAYSQEFIEDAETVLANARLNATHVQQVSVPDGYVLVPYKLTPEMIAADPYGMGYGRINAIYSAMLAAAPAAPAADAGVNDHD